MGWCNDVGVGVVVFTIIALFVMQWKQRVTWNNALVLGAIGIGAGLAIPNLTMVSKFQMTSTGGLMAEIRQTAQDVTVKAEAVSAIQRKVERLAGDVSATNSQVKTSEQQIAKILQQANETRSQVGDAGKRTAAALVKVRAVEEQTAKLLASADQTKGQVTAAGKRAAAALTEVKAVEKRTSVIQASVQQTLRSTLACNALSLGSRNIFPFPSDIGTELDKQLNILAVVAYPDPREREREVTRIMGMIKAGQASTQSPP